MWSIPEPSAETVRAFLQSQQGRPFSYDAVGASDRAVPGGFDLDHNRIALGHGRAVFDAACAALRDWRMLPAGWIRIHPCPAPLDVGQAVALEIRIGFVHSLNAARVVAVFDEPSPIRRFGFAYGTLDDHVESGEERFSVELADDGQVWYDLRAFSRPRDWVARAGYPFVRYLQRRFVRGSQAAMREACSAGGNSEGGRR